MSSRVLKKYLEEEKQLYFAISDDNKKLLNKLIHDGLDVNRTFNGSNQWGKSALHLCCEMGREECARILLDAGANTDAQDEWFQTPMMYSVCTERADMVKLILEVGCLLGIQDRYGKTALHFAVKNSELDCLRLLTDGGAPIDSCDDAGHTPLWIAVTEEGREKVIERLIAAGAEVNQRDWREKCTPLEAAILHSSNDTVKYLKILLKHGAQVNTIDVRGHTTMTSLICQKPGANQRGMSERNLDIAELLISSGYDVNLAHKPEHPNRYHGTALKAAAECGSLPFTTLLLSAGADPNIDDYFRATPIMYAALHGHFDVVKLLLAVNCQTRVNGCILLERERTPATPFYCAIIRKHWDIANLFILTNYDLSSESYLITNDNVPEVLVRNFEFWGMLRDIVTNCLTLSELCRREIRHVLGLRLVKSVLPIPARIKDFILMTDILAV